MMDGMRTDCSLCGRPRRLIAGVLACSRCDRADTWPSLRAVPPGLLGYEPPRSRCVLPDLLSDPRETGDPR